jgi:Bacterial Ig-like domain
VNLASNTALVTFTFSEVPTSFTLADTTTTGGTLGPLTLVNPTTYTATFMAAANTDGTGSVAVTAGSWQEGNGNPGTGGSTPSFTVDTVTPTVAVAISGADVNLAGDTAAVTFTFSEAPSAFTLADTSATGGTLSRLAQVDATHYAATFTAAAGTDIGNASVSVTAGSYQDASGNPGTAGSTPSFTVDTVTPTVAVAINNADVNLAGNPATVTFTFSEAPSAFTLADTSATGGTLSGLAQVDATHYAATFTAAAGTDIGNGSVSVTSGSWQEANGNPGTGGSTPSFTVDTVTPTVTVAIDSNDVNLAHRTAMASFAFSEAPTAFALADTSATGGTLSGLTQVDATHYTATFTAAAGTDIGNASVSVTSGSWQEANGNPGTGGSTPSFTVDTVAPIVTSVASSQGTFQARSLVTITLALSEAVSVSGGAPTLTLNDGGTATYDAAHSTATALVFDYTVGAGDTATSALAITSVNQNGATAQDAAGNPADLSAGQAMLAGTYINIATSGNATLTAGANSAISLGSGNDTVTVGTNSTVTLGNGTDSVNAGANATISLGNGQDTITAGTGSTVTAGNGNDTVSTGASDPITLGNGNDTVYAGANDTISLGNGNDTVYAGANDSISLGNGTDKVYAGASDTITLGKGMDTVAFGVSPSPAAIGNETVNNFAPGKDQIVFNHALFVNYMAVMSDAKQVGQDTIITHDPSDSVTLHGVALASLSASNFHFA